MMAVENIGAFNDDFRDGVKGHVFNASEAGFVGGALGLEESVKFGIVGAVSHPQINYDLVNYSKKPWAINPSQSVNYVSAHDNLTLWDKLKATNPEASDKQRIAMQKLANAIVLTSQGMPFLHLGVDFLRTKEGDDNSYKSPDSINAIDWTLKDTNIEVYHYYKGLIGIRKNFSAFRLENQEEIVASIEFFDTSDSSIIQLPSQMIGYRIDAKANSENNLNLFVLFNGSLESQEVVLPEGSYRVLANDQKADAFSDTYIEGGAYLMPGSATLILEEAPSRLVIDDEKDTNKRIILILIVLALLIVVIGSTFLVHKFKQDNE
jgi:pullulanase